MSSRLLLLACFVLSPLLSAEPLFKFHDGKAWQEFDSSGWEKLPRAEVTAKARDGKDRTYSGVPLADVLKLIGAPAGDTLRGPELGRFLLVTAADGYQVVFSLAELDASFRKQNIILADQVDGQPLSEFEGKRMIVSGDDLRHSRWIRQITGFSLLQAEPPKP